MLILLLALGLQTATASGSPAQVAMRCGAAAVVDGAASGPPLRTTAQFMYFAMHAAVADPAGKPFLERMGELAGSVDRATAPDAAAARTAMVACDRQFPLARTNRAVTLPADPFKRDVMCFGMLSLMNGAAEEIAKSGDTASHLRVQQALDPLNARLTDDVLKARGFDTEDKFIVFMGDQIKASMALGNPETVSRACGLKDA